MISREVVVSEVKDILREYLFRSPDVNLDDTLWSLGLDSLDHLELVMQLEDQFFFNATDADVENLRTVEDLVNLVMKRGRRED